MTGSNNLDIISNVTHSNAKSRFLKIAYKQMNCLHMRNLGSWELKEKNSEETPKKETRNF